MEMQPLGTSIGLTGYDWVDYAIRDAWFENDKGNRITEAYPGTEVYLYVNVRVRQPEKWWFVTKPWRVTVTARHIQGGIEAGNTRFMGTTELFDESRWPLDDLDKIVMTEGPLTFLVKLWVKGLPKVSDIAPYYPNRDLW